MMSKMRRRSILALTVCCWAGAVAAGQSVELAADFTSASFAGELWVSEVTGCTGDTIFVSVCFENESDPISVFGFKFHFDPNVLNYVNYYRGAPDPPWIYFGANEYPTGRIIVGAFSLPSGIPVGTTGTLIVFEFQVICPECFDGEAFPFQFTDVCDDLSNFVVTEGTFTYECETTPTWIPPTRTPTPAMTRTPTSTYQEGILRLPQTTGCQDDIVQVPLYFQNHTGNIVLFLVDVLYDPEMLSFISCSPGEPDPWGTSFLCNAAVPGKLIITAADWLGQGIARGSSGTLAEIQFQVACTSCAEGDNSPLTYDRVYCDIDDFLRIPGGFTYQCSAVPTETPTPVQTPGPSIVQPPVEWVFELGAASQ